MIDFYVSSDGLVFRSIGGGKGGSSPQPTSTTTTSSEPWGKQKPYLERGFEEAQRLYESDKPQYFPGSTVTPYAAQTERALGLREGLVDDSGSLINLAENELGKTLRGEYLGPQSPVYRDMLDATLATYAPGIDTGFASSGRFGSPLHAEALGRGIATGMSPYVSGERERMYGATAGAYPVSQYGADILGSVGAARESKSQEELQEEIDRFNFGQTIDSLKLREYMGAISPSYGQTVTSRESKPVYGANPWMGALGGAGTGASIGGSVGGPWGAGIGAALGGATGGASSTVICTAYHARGWVNDTVLVRDQAFGAWLRSRDPEVYVGYLRWATPVARAIEGSWLVAILLWPIAQPVIWEIARCGMSPKRPNWLLRVGMAVCRWLGKSEQKCLAS